MSPRKGRLKKAYHPRPPPTNKNGKLISTDEEKAEVLNKVCASIFTANLSPHPTRADGPQDGDQGGKKPLPL